MDQALKDLFDIRALLRLGESLPALPQSQQSPSPAPSLLCPLSCGAAQGSQHSWEHREAPEGSSDPKPHPKLGPKPPTLPAPPAWGSQCSTPSRGTPALLSCTADKCPLVQLLHHPEGPNAHFQSKAPQIHLSTLAKVIFVGFSPLFQQSESFRCLLSPFPPEEQQGDTRSTSSGRAVAAPGSRKLLPWAFTTFPPLLIALFPVFHEEELPPFLCSCRFSMLSPQNFCWHH